MHIPTRAPIHIHASTTIDMPACARTVTNRHAQKEIHTRAPHEQTDTRTGRDTHTHAPHKQTETRTGRDTHTRANRHTHMKRYTHTHHTNKQARAQHGGHSFLKSIIKQTTNNNYLPDFWRIYIFIKGLCKHAIYDCTKYSYSTP